MDNREDTLQLQNATKDEPSFGNGKIRLCESCFNIKPEISKINCFSKVLLNKEFV
jgi:hypothetical protein